MRGEWLALKFVLLETHPPPCRHHPENVNGPRCISVWVKIVIDMLSSPVSVFGRHSSTALIMLGNMDVSVRTLSTPRHVCSTARNILIPSGLLSGFTVVPNFSAAPLLTSLVVGRHLAAGTAR